MLWINKKKPAGWSVYMVADLLQSLSDLPVELRRLLKKTDFSDKVLMRLFPRAYENDSPAEEEYQRLLREDFVRQKLEGIDCFEKSIARRSEVKTDLGFSIARMDLAEEELAMWLGFFHDLRLLIATRLDITDENWSGENWEEVADSSNPEAKQHLLLHHLSYFEEMIVQALRESEQL